MYNDDRFYCVDGQLNIRAPGTNMRFRLTPAPLAEEKDHRGIWKACWPEFRLLGPESVSRKNRLVFDVDIDEKDKLVLEQKRNAFAGFRMAIRPDIATLVERFGSHQWQLLKLLHEEKAAMDLARSNPVLAYCLANNSEFRGTAYDAAAFQAIVYSHRKQRTILRWLGFPGSEAVVSLLRKIEPEAANPSLLRRLRDACAVDKDILPLLAHHKRINACMLELMADHQSKALVSPALLFEIESSPDASQDDPVVAILQEALNIIRQIAPHRKLRTFSNINQVREFGAAIDAEYAEYEKNKVAIMQARERQRQEDAFARRAENARRQAEEQASQLRQVRHKPFPPPPIPDSPEIVPITNYEELLAEGCSQHNCVSSYGGQVRKGGTYIYRVMYPERATLSIIKGADGRWHRDQLKKTHNQPVRQSTKRFVDNWLEQHQLLLM